LLEECPVEEVVECVPQLDDTGNDDDVSIQVSDPFSRALELLNRPPPPKRRGKPVVALPGLAELKKRLCRVTGGLLQPLSDSRCWAVFDDLYAVGFYLEHLASSDRSDLHGSVRLLSTAIDYRWDNRRF
jgi:hypothetical protein